ncbi:superoxide dismutase [Candidatus Kaiserbacteria bacterium CG10_big_fil_rev_8_21_14_0_10_59_10]|uniref:superoxide dismutase n=1 Tax=Candidatus Kaiserbacteria bacterium CG10_big_fil_rev_8_21_14_0_10_59_10 TaxID=1974612 RepID=A0A2H0U8E9_9BACT|nr:MAG: superoxide dismutase [Candidatus Kaiserbacteria bacterium CG10_big_fil_rev_8_21_14_0_10_59_10]
MRMHVYQAKTFSIPPLDGISEESVKQHIGLYEGYVKNFNAMSKQVAELAVEDADKYAHPVSELMRRRSFEFDGMRLHEYYFAQLEGGSTPLTINGPLAKTLAEKYSPYGIEKVMTMMGNIRGPGWAILYWDPEAKEPLMSFVGEQHQGHLVTLPIILALDVWEHSYILDYGALPAGKAKYIEAFFKNVNWGVVEERFAAYTS